MTATTWTETGVLRVESIPDVVRVAMFVAGLAMLSSASHAGSISGGSLDGVSLGASATGLPFFDGFESYEDGTDPTNPPWADRGPEAYMSVSDSLTPPPPEGSKGLAFVSNTNNASGSGVAVGWGDADVLQGIEQCGVLNDTACTVLGCGTMCTGAKVEDLWAKFDMYVTSVQTGALKNQKFVRVAAFEAWNAKNDGLEWAAVDIFSEITGTGDLSVDIVRKKKMDGTTLVTRIFYNTTVIDYFEVTDPIPALYEVVMHLVLDTDGCSDDTTGNSGNGVFTMWINGSQLIDRSDVCYRAGYTDTTFNLLSLNNNMNTGGSGAYEIYFDDVIVSETSITPTP